MKKFISIFLMVCMLVSMMAFMPMGASAASKKDEPKWYEKFTTSGDVKIDEASETATLTSNKGGTAAELWYDYAISEDYFDIEWSMTVEKRAGNENIQVRTGSKRVFFGVNTTAMSVQGGSAIPVNAPLGTSNLYRVVWEDGVGEFYFNDEFAGNFTLSSSTMKRGFGFWIQGISGDTQMVVENVTVYEKEVDASTPVATEAPRVYVPCYDYTMEFDDPSVVTGEEWKNTAPEILQFKNGMLDIYSVGDGGGFIRHWFGTPENFTLTMRYRMESIGDSNRLVVMWPNKRVTINFHEDHLQVNNIDSEKIHITDGQWHIMTVQGFNDGNHVSVYIDDQMLYSGAAANDSPAAAPEAQWHLNFTSNFTTTKSPCIAQVDWIKCVGEDVGDKPTLVTPMDDAAYLEGEKINFKAAAAEGTSIESVDFVANGNVIATASAPDFEATVTDLQPGKYKVYAQNAQGAKSASVYITVEPAVEGELQATANGDGLDMQVELFDRYQNVKEVEYFVDGVSVAKSSSGSNYAVNVPDINPSAHILTAFFWNKKGMKVGETSIDYINDVNTDKGSANYMNELSYTVTGDSGNAVYAFSNGTHKVQMTHSADKVVYLSDTGEQTFNLGTGDFKILTDGATADVYRNGQMAFSYYLPMTDEMGRSVQENGMKITNVTTSIPENKMNYFVKRNLTGEGIYSLDELPYYHNMDFIADQDDDVRLVLNDGYYRVDVELKDGKFYVRKTDKDRSDPYREEVAEAKEGTAYYRVETAAGMVRIYANGRWLTTFRGEHAEGDKYLAVQVSGGNGLEYVNVHDNTDLYFYEDDFSGNGENDSMDFWMYKGVEPYVGKKVGMTIDALGEDEAIAEVSAYAGNLDFTAEVEVMKEKGGFYILFNRAVTNGYSKIGYNFEEKQYELVDRNESSYTTKKTAPGEFPVGEKVQVRLKVEDNPSGKTAVLYVNGQEVLNCEKGLVAEFRGRFGFVLDDNVIYVSRVSYRGDAYVNIGITETVGGETTTDVLELEEGVITLTGNGGTRRYTSDGGRTWTSVAKPSNENNNVVQLRDKDGNPTGTIISVYRKAVGTNDLGLTEYAFFVARSDDNGESYKEIARMQPDGNSNRIVMNNRITQGPSGRLYFASCEDQSESTGCTVIYYSDDGGYNWTASETELSYANTGFVVAESVPLEMGNGVTRCYSRTDLGQVIYFESYDYGKTWDFKPHPTPFLSATNCYNIEVDPYNPDYMYAAWGYDNANLNSTVQSPRTRFGVAMSPDCGETWYYVGTAHENNSKNNHMMNLNINVTKDYLVVGQCFSVDALANVSNAAKSRDIFIPKAKIKPLMDFEQVHMRWSWISNVVTLGTDIQQNLLLASPANGTVQLHGELVTNAAYDNMLALDCAASYAGARAEIAEDGSAILKVGEKSVTISADKLADKDGKKYVDMDTFAELFGLICTDYKGIKIFDPIGIWSDSNGEILRAMVEPFYSEAE